MRILAAMLFAVLGTATSLPAQVVSFAPSPVAFGSVVDGSSAQLTVTARFDSHEQLSAQAISGTGFSLVSSACPLNTVESEGYTCSIVVVCAPTAVGELTGSLTLTNQRGSADSDRLTCKGLPLADGTISDQSTLDKCPSGTATGATCYSATESCPNTDNITVDFAVAGTGHKWMFVYYSGDPISRPDFAAARDNTANQLVIDGGQSVQIWFPGASNPLIASPSNIYPDNVLYAACRFDTATKYAYTTWRTAGEPFGIRGHSEGSGAGVLPLLLYNAGSYVDMFVGTATTPVANFLQACTTETTINMGCDPAGANNCHGQDATPTCDVPPGGVDSFGVAGGIFAATPSYNEWCGTTTCGDSSAWPPGDLTSWTNSSANLSNISVYSFPQTNVAIWNCCPYNETCGNGQDIVAKMLQQAVGYTLNAAGGQVAESCNQTQWRTGDPTDADYCDGESPVYNGNELTATYTTIYQYMETITRNHSG